MDVREFLLSEPRKSLSLCLISVCGCVSAIDLASASAATIMIMATKFIWYGKMQLFSVLWYVVTSSYLIEVGYDLLM